MNRYFMIEGTIELDEDSNPKNIDLLERLSSCLIKEIESLGGSFGGGIKEVDENGNNL